MAVEFDSEFIRRLEYLNIIARKIFAGMMRAERQSSKKGASVEFSDYRNYSAGDDFRYIDWNIYARQNEFLIKLFREEENMQFSIFIDCSASMNFGVNNKFDYARMLSGALAYIGLANMDSLNLMTFSGGLTDYVRGARGKQKIFQVLDFIKKLEAQKETNMSLAINKYLSLVKRRGLQIIISDFYDFQESLKALKALSYQQNEIFLIHVVDPWEENPALTGEFRLADVETDAIENITLTSPIVKRYQEAFANHTAELLKMCNRNEWGYMRAQTSMDYDQFVLRLLRRSLLG